MESVLSISLPSQAQRLKSGVEPVERARALHERLIELANLSSPEKVKIAREIAGLLITIETGSNLPGHLRHCFTRLRADADHRSGLSDAEGLRSPSEVWDYYERLEAAAV